MDCPYSPGCPDRSGPRARNLPLWVPIALIVVVLGAAAAASALTPAARSAPIAKGAAL